MFVGGLERDELEEMSVITNRSVLEETSSYERGIIEKIKVKIK